VSKGSLRWLTVRLALSSFLAAASAQAQDVAGQRPALHWTRAPGAESCIDPAQLAHGVEQTLGPVFHAPSDANVTLEANVSRTSTGFSLTVRLLGLHAEDLGQRTLEAAGRDCRALDALWMFVLALMLDPHAALAALPAELDAQLELAVDAALLAELRSEAAARAPRETAPSPQQAAEATPLDKALRPPPHTPPVQATSQSAREPALTARGRLAVGTAWGVTPDVSATVALGLDIEKRWWMVRVRASSWLPRTTRIDDEAHTARFSGTQLHLLMCPAEIALKSLRLDACLGAFAGIMIGRALGVADSAHAVRPTYGPALDLSLAWPFARSLAIAVDASTQWNARRDRFYVSSAAASGADGFRLPAVAVAGGLSLIWSPTSGRGR
jgi:hypothetical protein